MNDENLKQFKASSLAFHLAFLIAIPLVAFALLGKLLDTLLGTAPWLLVAGIVIAAITSTILVYRKAVRIINDQ